MDDINNTNLGMNDEDMIYSRKNNEFFSGGYRFTNEFINKDCGPFTVLQKGGMYESVLGTALQNLAVPTGLLFLQQSVSSKTNLETSLHTVKDDLYDTLVGLMDSTTEKISKKRNTRKRKQNKNKNTRKRR